MPASLELFGAIHILRGRPREKEALDVLHRVAVQVQPVMRKRGWRVPMLREFFPSDPSLLGINVNSGQSISIRLRPSHTPDAFMEHTQLVGTLLHELVHIVQGPHDAAFYKMLDTLTVELEDHMVKSVDLPFGFESFTGTGNRLGASTAALSGRKAPLHASAAAARKWAADAADKRRRLNAIMPVGGQKLGTVAGGPACVAEEDWKVAKTVCSPRELAGMAALRRVQDAKWCGSREDRAQVATDGQMSGPSAALDGVKSTSKSSRYDESSKNQENIVSGAIWSCQQCTLENPPLSLQCSCCLGIRQAEADIAALESDQHRKMAWTCSLCTLVNDAHQHVCQVCDSPR